MQRYRAVASHLIVSNSFLSSTLRRMVPDVILTGLRVKILINLMDSPLFTCYISPDQGEQIWVSAAKSRYGRTATQATRQKQNSEQTYKANIWWATGYLIFTILLQ